MIRNFIGENEGEYISIFTNRAGRSAKLVALKILN